MRRASDELLRLAVGFTLASWLSLAAEWTFGSRMGPWLWVHALVTCFVLVQTLFGAYTFASVWRRDRRWRRYQESEQAAQRLYWAKVTGEPHD